MKELWSTLLQLLIELRAMPLLIDYLPLTLINLLFKWQLYCYRKPLTSVTILPENSRNSMHTIYPG